MDRTRDTEGERMLSVVGAVFLDQGRVMAARRAPGRSLAGMWEFPGGKIEPGETPPEALAREISEELGIRVAVGDRVARHRTRTGDLWIDLDCYWVTLPAPGPLQSTDHDELRWVTAGEPASLPWAPADVPIMEDVVRRLSQGVSRRSDVGPPEHAIEC